MQGLLGLLLGTLVSYWPIFVREGGETQHMKVVGMLIVSLRGVNLGFWSHLGCSGQNAIICSSEGLI